MLYPISRNYRRRLLLIPAVAAALVLVAIASLGGTASASPPGGVANSTSLQASTAAGADSKTGTSASVPTDCPTYNYSVGTGTIVAGTQDTGNHCHDCTPNVGMPFGVALERKSTR